MIDKITISEDVWKKAVAKIIDRGDHDKAKKQLRSLGKGKVRRIPCVNRYYFQDLRYKTIYTAHGYTESLYGAIMDKDKFDLLSSMAYKYFSQYSEGKTQENFLASIIPEMLGVFSGKYRFNDGTTYIFPKCVTMFPVEVAKEIYQKYNVNGKVFDYACGWGGRMLAAMSLGLEYHGVDTNEKLVERLRECSNDFLQVNPESKAKVDIQCVGSEVRQGALVGQIGMCFSSPPYFDMEVYEGTQTSTTKFPEYDGWMAGYMKPTIMNCRDYLTEGGYLLVNIANTHKYSLYDDVKKLLDGIDGLEYVEAFPLKMFSDRKQAMKKNNSREKYGEEIMVFRKTSK